MRKKMKYILPICLLAYVLVMFVESTLYHSGIMSPSQLLWDLMLFVAGPVIFVTSIFLLTRKLLGKAIARVSLITALLALVLVPTWSFGFWAIGKMCRPLAFSLVVEHNKRLVEEEMQANPEEETFWIHGFRYPFCGLGGAKARHKNGVFFLIVPSRPGPQDTIIYDPKEALDHATSHCLANG